MFTLAQLSSFVAVAEELHFGHAAVRLGMTQPPLSRQIQVLETELEVRLLDRSSRAVRLTPAGRAFLIEARRVLHQVENAAVAARLVSAGEAGTITIGFTAASAFAALETVLTTAETVIPRVTVVLREMVTRGQVEGLTDGSLDLGLVRPPVNVPGLESRVIMSEPLVAAVPADHPLAAGDALPLTGLDGQPLIMYSPVEARYFHELLSSLFHTAGVAPVYTQYLSQVHSILALVNGGRGVALVPAAAARLRLAEVVFRPIHPTAAVELAMAWRAGDENPALGALLAAFT